MQNNPKEFGLIKMGKAAQKKPTTAVAAAGNVKNKLSCFDESDDSSDDGAAGPPGVDTRYQSSNAMKLAKAKINLAMEEDPNVFQYDEIYDDMKKDEQPKIVVSFDFVNIISMLANFSLFSIGSRRKETQIHD